MNDKSMTDRIRSIFNKFDEMNDDDQKLFTKKVGKTLYLLIKGYVDHEDFPYYERFLQEWVDKKSVCVFPEIGINEDEIKDEKGFDCIHFSDDLPFDFVLSYPDPSYCKNFCKNMIDKIKSLNEKYFNIFTIPMFGSRGKEFFSYNVIYAPIGFKEEFIKLIKYNKLTEYKYLFLHLVASLVEYKKNELSDWCSDKGIARLRKLDKELWRLEQLKTYLNGVNYSGEQDITGLTINFSGNTMEFKDHNTIYKIINKDLYSHGQVDPLPDYPQEGTLYIDLPKHNDYYRYFLNKIILSLNNFLKDNTPLKPLKNYKTRNDATDFIIAFLHMCGYEFYKNQKKGKISERILITDSDKKEAIVEKTITRGTP